MAVSDGGVGRTTALLFLTLASVEHPTDAVAQGVNSDADSTMLGQIVESVPGGTLA
jgi:hypothetical protein